MTMMNKMKKMKDDEQEMNRALKVFNMVQKLFLLLLLQTLLRKSCWNVHLV